jgi:hypothetical protein
MVILIPKQLRLDWIDVMAFDPSLSQSLFELRR